MICVVGAFLVPALRRLPPCALYGIRFHAAPARVVVVEQSSLLDGLFA